MRRDFRHLHEARLDLAREDVDAVDDEHVVGAGVDAVHDAHRAPALALLNLEAREVAGAVAHHRGAEAVEGGEDEFAFLAVGQRLEGVGIDDLRVEVVLPDVQPVRVLAVAGDAGAGDLGETVDVVGGDAGDLLDARADFVRPRLRAEDAVLQLGVAAEVDAELLGHGGEVEEVARRAADDGDAEVLHEHDLLFGVAGAGRQHRAAELLRAVVGAEAAGEESVAVGDLHHVVAGDAVHGHAPGDALGPDRYVAGGLRDADRLAGGAGGAVEAVDLAHRRGGEPERVLVAQVRLFHEGELREVLERHEVARLDAGLVAAAAEERHALVFVGDESLELLELQRPQLVDAHVVWF